MSHPPGCGSTRGDFGQGGAAALVLLGYATGFAAAAVIATLGRDVT